MTFRVEDSEFRYAKDLAVPSNHLTGWKWRYQPQFSASVLALGQTAQFTQTFAFDVGACNP
jgi:hypothetical protein